jgi:phage shock protein A
MGLFKRVSDIISANLNEFTEGLEDPEKMLKQAIREMEQSIEEATQQAAKALAQEKLLARELGRNREQAEQWETRAKTAVEAGDDGLARKALVRKSEHDKLVAALDDQLKLARDANQSLLHQLEGMRAKLAEAKRNLATLVARQHAADFRRRMEREPAVFNADADANAFAKFDRLKSKVEQAEAEAEAMAELRRHQGAPPHDTPELSEENLDVADQLAALKKKLGK